MTYKVNLLSTPIAHEIFEAAFRLTWAYVNAPQSEDTDCHSRHLIVLVGPTGVGKTRLVRAIGTELLRRASGASQAHIPFLHVIAQLTKANGMNFRETWIRALQQASEPLIDRKVVASLNELPELKDARRRYERATEAAYRDALLQMLEHRCTQLFALDDAQELLRTKAVYKLSDPLVTMRGMVDSTSTRILLSGVYEMLDIWASSAHLMRRTRLVEFGRYKETEAGLKGFVAFLKCLDLRVPLSKGSYVDHAEWLWQFSYGCPGLVVDLIAEALDVSIGNDDKKFAWSTISSVQRLQVHVDQHRKEVDAGERLLAEFRLKSAERGADHPNRRPARRVGRVGKRKPSRDRAFGISNDA